MNKSKILRLGAVLGAVAIIGASALSAGPTFAARGGTHGGGQTSGGGTRTCAVTPNIVPNNSAYVVSGSGFAGQYVNVTSSLWTWVPNINADGTFALNLWASTPGSYTVSVVGLSNGKSVLLATCNFQITP